ncbi:hypothetical protein CN309_05295 [Bacillus thuringiensis]|uniref:hypothetical protein n=1 Tax=Bacillus thuringiensis TaxID=1428 RepID=UPI000BF859A9|nr:hypothetical protein [Bacillus thuringiensis]PFD67682.1 hypothetical protein CN309_05295 [Bacillus thuringiensis]
MTLIAAYSYEPDRTVFVNDFRTTIRSKSLRADNAFKFKQLGSSVGLYLAGNVNGWNHFFEREEARLQEIEHENFIEEFLSILRDYALSATPILDNGKKLSALGFIIDEASYSNKAFHIDYIQGGGAIINELEKHTVYLIGSGADIEGLKEHVNNILLNYTSDPKRPPRQKEAYLVADLFARSISNYITNLNDPKIYEKKGISNIFGFSYLEQSYFEMCSYSETKFEKDNKIHKQFVFDKNDDDIPVLKDKTNNITSTLSSVNKIVTEKPIIIDPFNREGS